MPYPDNDYNEPDSGYIETLGDIYADQSAHGDQWINLYEVKEMIQAIISDRVKAKCIDCGASNPIGETLIPIVETTLLMGDLEAHMCTGCIRQLEHTGNTPYTLTPIQYRVNRNPYYRGSK